ncbi:tetratricopeptide (TPR) repeat protein [Sphingomonas zeicaulis]|uniref:sulfotransferase n=1 Tax=Sphingomonas zeicaulis TaxID=1632740 RepID=UPI003D22F6FF
MTLTSDRLTAAIAAFNRGDIRTARIEGEAALRDRPRDAAVLQLLGVACATAGDAAAGIDYFRRAIAAGADTPDNRINLAKALAALDRFDEALALCPVTPGTSPQLLRLRAELLKAQGRQYESAASYEQFVDANPGDVEGWNNLGNARHEMGDLEGALAALKQARVLQPASSLIHLNMARVLVSMDRHQDACLVYEEAAKLAPKDPVPLLELGRTLIALDHAPTGLRALGAAARLDPQNPKIFLAIGLAFADLSDFAQAEKVYRIALQFAPRFTPAYLNLGILLERGNRVTELDALIAQAVAAGAVGGEIDYLRALSLRRRGALAEALALASSIRTDALDPTMLFHFIGELADRMGEVGKAYQAFDEMNRAAAQSPLGMAVDRGAYQRDIERIERLITPEWFGSWQPAAPAAVPPSPVFLVGFPRSGTTLLDTMLMGHSATHVLEEVPILDHIAAKVDDVSSIPALDAAAVASLRASYFTELEKRAPGASAKLVIDKNPLSMLRLPLIHRLFPDARIILALRHPCDVVLSCFMQNFKPTEAMASFLDLTNASRTYDRVFRHWETCRSILPVDVHVLRYEDMVADTEGTLRPLIDFLGLDWEERAMNHRQTARDRGHIRTPSYAQVTEAVYARASGRWTRYRDQMRYALPILAPWVERFGYSLD